MVERINWRNNWPFVDNLNLAFLFHLGANYHDAGCTGAQLTQPKKSHDREEWMEYWEQVEEIIEIIKY